MRTQDVDQKLAAEGTKLNFADRGKYLSERWKVLPAEEKQRYTVRLIHQLFALRFTYCHAPLCSYCCMKSRVADGLQ